MIEIMEREGGYYIFTDVAEMFWPGTWENGNHEAEARIQERMEQEGCCHVPGSLDWETRSSRIRTRCAGCSRRHGSSSSSTRRARSTSSSARSGSVRSRGSRND